MNRLKNFQLYTFVQNFLLSTFYFLLFYMPLHILLSTWLGTSFGALEVARVAKEGLLLLGAGIALVLGLRAGIVKQLLRDRLVWLIAAFILLNVVLAAWRSTDLDAELLGLAYNTRFFVFFIWAALLTKLYPERDLIRPAIKLVLVSGALTVGFGLIQYTVLPDDELSRIGYQRSNGVLPAFHIDDKPDLERIMSTVRDPNSYGSYLIIIISLLLSLVAFTKRARKLAVFCLLPSIVALFWTFSRSAWLGAGLALLILAMFAARQHKATLLRYRVWIIGALVALVVLGISSLGLFWNSYWVQNVVFHADEATVLEDPNQLRMRFWRESAEGIIDQPLGEGPGTAGLASIRNDEKTVLNENYYLQMAQETGVIGLILFMAILTMVGWRLWLLARDGNWLAIGLLASFMGLALTNFLVHIWANEAVAYTWWGLAGLTVALNPTHKLRKRL